MLPILQIGPLALPLPPLSLLLALWFGLSLAEKMAPQRGFSADALYNLTFTGLIAGLIGARLGYVFQYPNAFLEAPLSLISPNPGLLDPFGGFAAGLIGMLIYGQRARLTLWKTLDALTPVLAALLVGLALAHIASGEAFGTETHLPWGINLWGATRHPTQFYELGMALALLAFLGWKSKDRQLPDGAFFLLFTALAAGSRLFLEAFRGDSTLIWGGLRLAQVLAWVLLAAALWALERKADLKTDLETDKRIGKQMDKRS
jgi:phosphatidylglycerol:prolipoprotein diacylglycerol transferase